MKKKCIFLILIIFLFGCAKKVEIQSEPKREKIDWLNLKDEKSTTISLFFVTIDGKRLEGENREIVYSSSENIAFLAVNELIKGPTNTRLQNIMPDVELLNVSVSGNVANVDFGENFNLLDQGAQLRARASIANTLIKLTDVEYVNIFVGGYPMHYYYNTLGAMGWLSGNLYDDYIIKIQQERDSFTSPSRIVLTYYFPDITKRYLVCEAREIIINDLFDYSTNIIDELLIKGPSNQDMLTGLFVQKQGFPPPLVEISNFEPFQEYPDSTLLERLKIEINAEPVNDELTRAAITSSLQSFYTKNKIYNVAVFFDSNNLILSDDNFNTRTEYLDYIGQIIKIYFKHDDDKIIAQDIVVPQNFTPDIIINELINGPLTNESSAVFPSDVNNSDLISTHIAQDIVVVNFNKSLLKKCDILDNKAKTILIYSIVNSLCEIKGINRVMFLFDGNEIDTFGKLNLSFPLFKNPNIVF